MIWIWAITASANVCAQISDSLYQSLHAENRPADRSNLTSADKRRILEFALDDSWPPSPDIESEIDKYAQELEAEAKSIVDVNTKVLNYAALGGYHQYHKDREGNKGSWVPYYEKVIECAQGNTKFQKQVGYAMKGIAIYQVQKSKYEEASVYLNKALNIFTQLKDTSGIGAVHAYYYPLYSSLNLYNLAITEQNLALKYITADEKQRGLDVFYTHENYQDKALTYLSWYESEHNPKHLDSADAYLSKMPLKGENELRWRSFHYFLIGYRAFLVQDFRKALVNIDSSLSIREYYSEMNQAKLIHKGISLLKLGKKEEGRKILLDTSLNNAEHYLLQIAYEALYDDARERKDFANAINYSEKARIYRDSTALITQRGKVFEIMQKYAVIEKEAEIKQLEYANYKKEQQHNTLLLVFTLIAISLLIIIIGLYAISRDRKLKGLEAEALLAKERRNNEDIIRLQERDLQRNRRKIIYNLKKKISRDMHDELTGALAGLKYYVNDLRKREENPENKDTLRNIELEVESVYKQARTYMHNLSQGIEEAVGNLTPFLQHISQDFGKKKGIDIRLKYDKEEVELKLTPNQQNQLTLMLKEATSNILKHAGATIIEISISFDSNTCYFSISDNGRGIGKEMLEKGLGMESMDLRIRRIKGRTRMQSSSSGTTIKGSFPLS